MKILITGSCGLIGSEAVSHYASQGHQVIGIDNNLRQYFFGPQGNTQVMKNELERDFPTYYQHESIDIRDKEAIEACFKKYQPDFVIHSAAQPSHDWAAKEPFTDFSVNAVGTLNLLEAFRQITPEATFALLSTNKVYGDSPNHLPLIELPSRFEFNNHLKGKGISEEQSVDQCLHSLFGASKLAGDILCQEYGRYFGLNIGIFRGGCLTGSRHQGVKLHGFLSYLVQSAVEGRTYQILGYQGKQVRDQIHSSDVIQALDLFRLKPRSGEVYNLGGGYENSASILEVIGILKQQFGLELETKYLDSPRIGDHICYYSDMSKFVKHYPNFKLKMNLSQIIEEMIADASTKIESEEVQTGIAA